MADQCKTCRFFESASTTSENPYGYCHRFPPVTEDEIKIWGDYWCGEYRTSQENAVQAVQDLTRQIDDAGPGGPASKGDADG